MSTLKKEIIAAGKHLLLVRQGNWEYAERLHAKGVVVIVATTDERKLVLTEQYRIPVQAFVIELPAGLIGDTKEHASEDIFLAAQRELLEETGYDAKCFSIIMSGPSSAGLSSEINTMVHAYELRKIGSGGGVNGENILVHVVGLEEAFAWLKQKSAQGILIDPKILAALYYLSVTATYSQSSKH